MDGVKTGKMKQIEDDDETDFPLDMDASKFQRIVASFIKVDKKLIRSKASKNKSLKKFIESERFLLEYARLTNCTNCLPPNEYIIKQQENGFFAYKRNNNRFCLKELVFDKTRHGFAQIDIPFDANHGVKAIQDIGKCISPCKLRNIYVLENMNVPVCRFDPLMFCQSWVLSLLRPKFVFRGMVACPEGDYGLARLIVELGNAKGKTIRSETSVAFKNGDKDKLGRFVPFEVTTPNYSFQPSYVFFFVCVFYVNRTEMRNRGMRIANCTVQCVLPNVPEDLNTIDCNERLPAEGYDNPLHACSYTVHDPADPEYLKLVKKRFYSVLDNTNEIRAAETARAEKDIELMMGENILEDRVGIENDEHGKMGRRKHVVPDSDGHDEPPPKKIC